MLDGRGALENSSLAQLVLALVCWGAVYLRRPDIRTGPAGRRLWLALIALAVGTTLAAWPLGAALDRWFPDRTVAGACYGAFGMLSVGLGAVAIVEWAAPELYTCRARRVVNVALGVVVCAEFVGLLSLPRTVTTVAVPDHRLAQELANHPQAYLSLALVPPTLALGIVVTTWCCLWSARIDPGGLATRTLYWVLLANCLLTAWLGLRLVGLVVVINGGPADVSGTMRASDLVFELAVASYLTAFIALRATVLNVLSWAHNRRSLLQMRPLWQRAVGLHPQVVLEGAGWWRDAFDPRDLPIRRYRRVIEFRDAARLMLPHLCPDRRARVRAWLGTQGEAADLDLLADAVEFELASRAVADDRRACVTSPPPDAVTGAVKASAPAHGTLPGGFGVLLIGGDSIDDEIQALLRAARLQPEIGSRADAFTQHEAQPWAASTVAGA